MQIRPGIELAGLSDVGCQRKNNEDRYSYWEPVSDEEFRRKGRLAIVADGMGGYEGGQEASGIAVETVEEVYAGTLNDDPRSLLNAGFRAAHQRIQEQASKNLVLHGMGTTCTRGQSPVFSSRWFYIRSYSGPLLRKPVAGRWDSQCGRSGIPSPATYSYCRPGFGRRSISRDVTRANVAGKR